MLHILNKTFAENWVRSLGTSDKRCFLRRFAFLYVPSTVHQMVWDLDIG